MTEFFRREHERFRNGQWETVQGHWVVRDGGYCSYSRPNSSYSGRHYEPNTLQTFREVMGCPRHFLDENKPNALCPECGAEVWFFRNHETGGCAYFDAIGKPWPKHPCMDRSHNPLADRHARFDYYWAYFDEQRFDFGDLDLNLLSAHELRSWILMLQNKIADYLRLANAVTANSGLASNWKRANPGQELPSRDSRRLWKLESALQYAKDTSRVSGRG